MECIVSSRTVEMREARPGDHVEKGTERAESLTGGARQTRALYGSIHPRVS